MKVLVLGFTKISYMPYMHFYIEQLKKNNCDIHLLYWKRDRNPDDISPEDVTTYIFDRYQEDSAPLLSKTGSFYKYRRYVLKVIKEQKFDQIVVLHSTPGVLLNDILRKKYKGKYILDYRDFTYENYSFYKKMIHKLVNNSSATFVSSDAYREYLPKINSIFTSHNFLKNSLKHKDNRRSKARDVSPIRIRFWGFIRHKDINTLIINKLANDNRFELHYHGREQKIGQFLKNYCEENKISNIFFHGEYKPDDRFNFIKETDLLHNMYDNDRKTINAMGNKYYDGVTFYIPQLCNIGSFMGEQVEKNNIGMNIDPNSPTFANEIYDYYRAINWKHFEQSCDTTLDNIITQYKDGTRVIEEILDGKRGEQICLMEKYS